MGYGQLQRPLEALKVLLARQQQRARRFTALWGTIIFSLHHLLRRCGARALAVTAALSGGGGGGGPESESEGMIRADEEQESILHRVG